MGELSGSARASAGSIDARASKRHRVSADRTTPAIAGLFLGQMSRVRVASAAQCDQFLQIQFGLQHA
jgi:hypothetical protein